MSLSLWTNTSNDPFWAVRDIQRQMDSVFNDFWGGDQRLARRQGGQGGGLETWAPVVDMRESDNSFIIHAELPGIKKEDISLDLNDNVLTLTGERKEKKKEENERVYRVERTYGKFSRTFTLPKNADTSKILANFQDGVLELNIPKSLAKLEGKRIPIQDVKQSQSQ